MSLPQRQALVEQDARELPLRTQAALLTLSRSSLYYRPASPSAREVTIKHRIDELYTATPFYGSRKIQVLLQPEFGTLARNTVRRYMQETGIAAIYPGPNLSRRHHEHQIYPYLMILTRFCGHHDGTINQEVFP